jgi:hypothetical protein
LGGGLGFCRLVTTAWGLKWKFWLQGRGSNNENAQKSIQITRHMLPENEAHIEHSLEQHADAYNTTTSLRDIPRHPTQHKKWEQHSNEEKTRSTSCKTESQEPQHVSQQRGCFCHGVFVFCVLCHWRQGKYRIDVRNMYLIEFAFSL